MKVYFSFSFPYFPSILRTQIKLFLSFPLFLFFPLASLSFIFLQNSGIQRSSLMKPPDFIFFTVPHFIILIHSHCRISSSLTSPHITSISHWCRCTNTTSFFHNHQTPVHHHPYRVWKSKQKSPVSSSSSFGWQWSRGGNSRNDTKINGFGLSLPTRQPVYFAGRIWICIWVHKSTRQPVYLFFFLKVFFI